MTIQGNGFKGTPARMTTHIPNQEIIPDIPVELGWSEKKYSFYKFSFHNFQECTVKINGSEPILLLADQGFESSDIDVEITSFIIEEVGITYQFIGAY
jgi:hypothetical protein